MRHKPFEHWILNNTPLTKDESNLLNAHLKTCADCQHLQTAWLTSEKLLQKNCMHSPKQGFTQRWQVNMIHKREHERVIKVRRNLLLLIILLAVASTVYMLQNNLFTTWIVSAISLLTSLFFTISKVLAGFNSELNQSPILYYGFTIMTFGALLSFIAAFTFFVWNLLHKKRLEVPDEAEN